MARQPSFQSSPAFEARAVAQHQVLSWSQAREVGIDRHHIARRVASRTWQLIGRHVVVLHSGPLSLAQLRWVAVLYGGDEAALFGVTALEAAGLKGFEGAGLKGFEGAGLKGFEGAELRGFDGAVQHVVALHGHGRRDLVTEDLGIKVHEGIHLGPDAIHPLATPRRQRVERAAVDAAASAPNDGACRAVIAAVIQQRLARAQDLRAYPERVPTLRRRRLILETIDDVAGGAQSLPEMEWNAGIRRAGLPQPTRQQIVKHPGGSYHLDADFELWKVTVEINGAQHLTLPNREADDDRRFQLSLGGRLVVDISSSIVRHDIDRAVLRTARALHARGWRPEPVVLRRLEAMATRKGQAVWPPELIFPSQSDTA